MKNIFALTRLLSCNTFERFRALLGGGSAQCRFEIMTLFIPRFKTILLQWLENNFHFEPCKQGVIILVTTLEELVRHVVFCSDIKVVALQI